MEDTYPSSESRLKNVFTFIIWINRSTKETLNNSTISSQTSH